jgi:quinol-cytochrome oxidoreductase complex cytochrome b subunit
VSPLVTLPHIALVIAAAFLIGVRAYGETQPKGAVEADEDKVQLLRFAKVASVGLVLLTLAVVIGLDLGFARVAKVLQ